MKKILVVLFTIYFVSVNAQQVNLNNLKKHIEYLSSEKLEGRRAGTKGEKLAAQYIVKYFEEYKLLPKGTTNYFQEFEIDQKDSTKTVPSRRGNNVIGFLDNNKASTIILGAHYDHLGYNEDKNSLEANSDGKIHNGADDNASGVAGMLELANVLRNNNKIENYNFLFIAFSGEELGLLGSKSFTALPNFNSENYNMMINMDMIGRLDSVKKEIIVSGVGTSSSFVELINKYQDKPLKIKLDSSGYGPSDHTSFYLKNIPVLHFFTGIHKDYHKPSDDFNRINFEGEKLVLDLILSLLYNINEQPKLNFLKTKNTHANETKTTYKVTLGIMPDYVFNEKGVKVDGVSEGRPAEKAGIIEGDIIIKLGDFEVSDMQSYMKALGKFSKGQTTKVIYKRGTQILENDITF